MATDRNTLKNWFKRLLKPKEVQFAAWIDSFWHKTEDSIPIANITNLSTILADKIDRQEIENITGKLLLERRFTASLETQTFSFYVGREVTNIYRVTCDNVKSISVNGTDIPLTPFEDNERESQGEANIDGVGWITINIENKLTDTAAGVFIEAKAKPD
ncbi:MAG: hypothetical protein E6767_20680 [Dysgonomonas sp.]|nr:hypothetical protein [Dysgonomonas sp.]